MKIQWFYIIFIVFAVNECKIQTDDFNSSKSLRLSEKIYLHRTSGKDFMITDEEGMGLIYGEVTRLGYEDRLSILVEFVPFDSTHKKSEINRIDLKSGAVSPSIRDDFSVLQHVGDFFEQRR